jgi:hypothetical protein
MKIQIKKPLQKIQISRGKTQPAIQELHNLIKRVFSPRDVAFFKIFR